VTLGQILLQRMDEIEIAGEEARRRAGRSPRRSSYGLLNRLQALLESSDRFDPDRLNQEALLIAA